ncbi:Iota-carrageenase precursor [Planctomycetes bacterium CA13]|uniref:Iota-carrageenase n=1 Tax=Novipirellula herctigrandis TaxID=2527986 RepID=A0A5C5YY19_9BACT|nr:Iota-carrageenase precursor [Planctomycetes bacterium CA13]
MNINKFILALLFAIPFLDATGSNAAYIASDSYQNPKLTVAIGSAHYPVKSQDNSKTFQKAIDDVHAGGGGHVVVPAGEYRLMDIQMKSNVHVIFKSGVVLRPRNEEDGNLFNFGMKEAVQNTSLIGSDDRTVFDFTGMTSNLRAVCVNDCNNFRVANFTVNDNRTVYSSFTFGWGGVRDGVAEIARNGLIENLTANDAHYGYGAIQAHSGENMIFRNIKSVGGVGVRLETGYKKMNLSGVGGLFNILVENVSSKNGQAALMFQPHTMKHGDVVARNIRSDGSEFCVYIANPFVSKKKYGPETEKVAGSFKSITVEGVQAVYRDGPIVTRYPHLEYYPKELHASIVRIEEGSEPGYRGPSIAAVANMQPEEETISITNVEATGFQYRRDIMTPDDLFRGSIKHLVNPQSKK